MDQSASVNPTFTPAHFERVMNTRSSASSLERRQRTMQAHPPSSHRLANLYTDAALIIDVLKPNMVRLIKS